MTRKADSTGDHLDAVFQIVIDEARTNKSFATRLRSALDGGTENPTPPPNKPVAKSAKPYATPEIHAVNVLRQHGEKMLRGRLSNLRTKKDLNDTAKRSGLRLTGAAARKSATREDLIDGIIAAALQYDSQRESAEG